jgi:hypothetical protein
LPATVIVLLAPAWSLGLKTHVVCETNRLWIQIIS